MGPSRPASGNCSDFQPTPTQLAEPSTKPASIHSASFASRRHCHLGALSSAPGLRGPRYAPKSLGEGGGAISFFQLVSPLCIDPFKLWCNPPREGESSPNLAFNFCSRVAHILLFEAGGTLSGALRGMWGSSPRGVPAGEGVGAVAEGGGGEGS